MAAIDTFIEHLDANQIVRAEDAQKLLRKYNGDVFSLMNILLRKKPENKTMLGRLWGDSIGIAYVDIEKMIFQSPLVDRLPEKYARKFLMIPLYQMGEKATVVCADPVNTMVIKEIEKVMGVPISAVFSFPDDIMDAINVQYQSTIILEKFIEKIPQDILHIDPATISAEQLKQMVYDESVAALVRALMLLGVKEKATSIHIEHDDSHVRVRFRIDGVLHSRFIWEKSLCHLIAARLKVQAKLDVGEKRRIQEGRLSLSLQNKAVDFRFSSVPSIYGDNIVLQIASHIRPYDIPDITEIDLSASVTEGLKIAVNRPAGLFFVAGPVGSGKTTTLYSILKYLNRQESSILTVENPIEYRLNGVSQIQTDRFAELMFPSVLKAFLIHDADVILIGEFLDPEVAQIAVRAARAGHLVLSAVYTNTAVQAIQRLEELNIDSRLSASVLSGVLAQRLCRRICHYCKERYPLTPEQIDNYFICKEKKEVNFYRGKGCPECGKTGYSGKIAIHELININAETGSLIAKKASSFEIENSAEKYGFHTMRYDGMKKVLRGLTTIEEVERVTAPDIE